MTISNSDDSRARPNLLKTAEMIFLPKLRRRAILSAQVALKSILRNGWDTLLTKASISFMFPTDDETS